MRNSGGCPTAMPHVPCPLAAEKLRDSDDPNRAWLTASHCLACQHRDKLVVTQEQVICDCAAGTS